MEKRSRRRIRDLVALAEPAAERAKEHGCAQMDCAQMGRLLMISSACCNRSNGRIVKRQIKSQLTIALLSHLSKIRKRGPLLLCCFSVSR
jgi:hypothetical protein